MSISLAPIGLSTYNRLSHLQRTIEALQKNKFSLQSELFVFSDAPKSGDEEKVEAVRSFLKTIDGFKAVHILERTENNRVKNNRGGMRMLLERYGRMIFLEEDVITAPSFLTYMNQALEKYEDDEQIFSVSAYCPKIKIPSDYEHDIFLFKRFNAWGFGIWKNRFEQINYVTLDEYNYFAGDADKVAAFINGGGKDMMKMLTFDAKGLIDALDVKARYAQFLSNQYTVFPTSSLSFNIGMDSSGEHCDYSTRFRVILSEKNSFIFPENLMPNKKIIKANINVWNGYYVRLKDKCLRVIHNLKNIINKKSGMGQRAS
jgi:hypothetical protein